ncbi:MAG: DUF1616 domain-containing protein [Candidatus Ranarchaeia archaeon]
MTTIKREGVYDLNEVGMIIIESLENAIEPMTVGEIVQQFKTEYGIPSDVILQVLQMLSEKGKINIHPPKRKNQGLRHTTKKTYVFHEWLFYSSAGKEALLVLSYLTLIFIVFMVLPNSVTEAITILQIALGITLILFFPGFALTSALFPRLQKFWDFERLALSIAISLGLVPTLLLVTNFLPLGFVSDNITIILELVTLIGVIVASIRKYNIYQSSTNPLERE